MLQISEVFSKIEVAAAAWKLSPKETNTLRLLGEEMVGMTENMVHVSELDFFVKSEEKNFELHLTAKADISPEKKIEFIEASTNKKNESEKGFKGKLKSLFENLLYSDTGTALASSFYGVYGATSGIDQTIWSMDSYLKTAPQEEQKKDWDGLEKSILANLADDIIIGATTQAVEMTVKKSF